MPQSHKNNSLAKNKAIKINKKALKKEKHKTIEAKSISQRFLCYYAIYVLMLSEAKLISILVQTFERTKTIRSPFSLLNFIVS